MRSVPDTVSRWKQQFHQQQLQHPCEQQQRVRFGGMFTSIPFWKLETYDRSREHPRLLEHCRTFKDFVDDMRTSLRGTVDVLADNAWVLVHCGPMRDSGRRCDLAFEIKKILQDDLGLELIDEIVLTPPHNTNLMRAGTLYEPHCKLINANTRIVVAWKVSAATLFCVLLSQRGPVTIILAVSKMLGRSQEYPIRFVRLSTCRYLTARDCKPATGPHWAWYCISDTEAETNADGRCRR